MLTTSSANQAPVRTADEGRDSSRRDDVTAIRLETVTKRYGDVTAVDGVDLEIADGEFFSMLGPSGSGKTTVLRLVAGFITPDAGHIHLDGEDVTRRAPFDRDVNTVFQDYALFPHLSVLDNVAYGLRVRRVPRAERREMARDALRTVELEHVANRRPSQLSGGQQQRVALARSIVVRPKVLLLDEPLGALDLKLREQMQVELKQLQRELGITFVFVTHDQQEALTLSDRIAVFDAGRIVQVGTPAEVYEHPASAYVASFVGTSNLFTADVSEQLFATPRPHALRPERVQLTPAAAPTPDPAPDGRVRLAGTVVEAIYLGASQRVHVELDGRTELVAVVQNTGDGTMTCQRGDAVVASWSVQDLVPLT